MDSYSKMVLTSVCLFAVFLVGVIYFSRDANGSNYPDSTSVVSKYPSSATITSYITSISITAKAIR